MNNTKKNTIAFFYKRIEKNERKFKIRETNNSIHRHSWI